MKTLNIILADNQSLTRNGIINILTTNYGKSINIIEVITKDELIEALLKINPDALIIDIELFDFNDITELVEIKKIHPYISILVVSDNKSPNEVLKVIDTGIKNYVLKSCEAEELLEAFNATLINKKYFCNASMDIILEHKTTPKNTFESKSLTSSEIAIVKLITLGLTTKEIATQKNLSFHTINAHRKNIFRKLGIGNSSELLMYAIRAGIIDTTEYYI
jgi:DNA-binding NarL/FixJ family response regulator